MASGKGAREEAATARVWKTHNGDGQSPAGNAPKDQATKAKVEYDRRLSAFSGGAENIAVQAYYKMSGSVG